ncbi:immunoglobulin domain-containing protein, partial [Odoribacter sp. OttesenSCG-928-L07]|nr:immunoglobulin domain-containing protein [Odoribacter sp. OttesenSCG-928-L07]
GCSAVTSEIEINSSTNTIEEPEIRSIPEDAVLCGDYGRVVLSLINPEDFLGYSFKWYKDNTPMSETPQTIGDIPELLLAISAAGEYRICIYNDECITFSDPINVRYQDDGGYNIFPTLTVEPAGGTICGENGSVLLYAADWRTYPVGTEYSWYRDNILIAKSELHYYIATGSEAAGTYYMQVVLPNGCSSTSSPGTVLTYDDTDPVNIPLITSEPGNNEICGDDGVVILSLTNPEDFTNPTYRWYKDNASIPDATSNYYAARTPGNYTLQVTNEDGCAASSGPITVDKIESDMIAPQVSLDPDAFICGANSSVLITVTNTSDYEEGSTYVWFKGSDIVYKGIDYTIYEAKEAGTYSVAVIEGECATISSGQIIVNSQYVIENIPIVTPFHISAVVCGEHGTVELTFSNANLFEGYTIDWYKDNVKMSEHTGKTLIYISEEGSYRVKVSITDCSAFSEPVNVTYDDAGGIEKPILTMYPATEYLCSGGSVLMYVSNVDDYSTGSVFKWYKGSTLIAQGVDMDVYETTSVGVYHVIVLDNECASVSNGVTLTSGGSILKPSIVSTSGGTNICEPEGSIILTLNKNDYFSTATFQWYKNNKPIDGETNTIIIITEAGSYRLQVMEGNCSALSTPIDVTKDGSGDITKPILDYTPEVTQVCLPNGSIKLSVKDPIEGAYYNWFKNNKVVQLGESFVYYVNAAGNYFVQVIVDDCSAISDDVDFTETTSDIKAVSLTYFPNSLEICENGAVVIFVDNAYDYVDYSYSWYRNNVLIPDENDYMLSVTQAGTYHVQIIADDNCAVVSPDVIVTESETGTIPVVELDVWPDDARIVNSSPVEIKVVNKDDYTGSTYFWLRTKGGSGFTNPVKAFSGIDLYEIYAEVAGDYRLLIASNDCAVWSDIVEVRREDCDEDVPDPIITVVPGENPSDNYEICLPEGSVLLQVQNHGYYETPSFQWYKNNTPISGQTSSTIEVTNTDELGEGSYRVRVTDKGCTVSSSGYNVVLGSETMDDKPEVSLSTNSNVICGANGSIILTFSNPELFPGTTYQWFKNNYEIGNAFAIDATGGYNLEVSQAGSYRVAVIDGTCAAFSTPINITKDNHQAITKPVITKVPNSTEICIDGTIRLYVSSDVSGYSNPVYNWYKDNILIQSSNSINYFAETA